MPGRVLLARRLNHNGEHMAHEDPSMAGSPFRGVIDSIRRAAARSVPGVSDAQLLARFAGQRDEAAFELLVWRHGKMVLSTCRRLLRNAHDAEDALQACFL